MGGCCQSVLGQQSEIQQPLSGENSKSDKPQFGSQRQVRLSRKNFLRVSNKRLSQKYDLCDVIGEGGFGIVRKAKHKKTGLERAVKSVLKSRLGQDKFSEFNYLKELDHPHILQVIEVIEEVRYIHLVTELCTGGDLFDKIDKQSFFSENQAARYLKDILAAISYCHSRNVIHLDIKPENILLSDDQADQQIKLIDFGISQLVTGEKQQFKGTVNFIQTLYSAPETFDCQFNQQADVWSCGVLLYILLCGYPPFNGQTESQIKKSIINDELTFPSPEWDKVSGGAKKFLTKLLRKNPDERVTARHALKSSWLVLRAGDKLRDRKIASNSLKNLSQFRVNCKQAIRNIRYAALSFIASQLTAKEDIKELQSAFLEADVNNDGSLNREELKVLIQNTELGIPLDIDRIMEECDADQNGLIEYSEFLTACMNWNKALSLEKLEAAFDSFDQDGNGTIDLEEIKTLLGQQEINDQDLMNLVQEADKNGDQLIDLEEFIHAVMKMTPVTF